MVPVLVVCATAQQQVPSDHGFSTKGSPASTGHSHLFSAMSQGHTLILRDNNVHIWESTYNLNI